MPSSLLHPALAHHDGKSGSESSSQVSELYYTNEGGKNRRQTLPQLVVELTRFVALEITVIHDIVTSAQVRLDQLPEVERLPTNELFQAYDAVLPTYGIDPENDQHLSRLVFRIGGERGDGTLLDKFRAVLSRMGIEIEFDITGPVPQDLAVFTEDGDDSVASRPLGLRTARRRSDTEISTDTRQSRPAIATRSLSFTSSSGVAAEVADTARLISSQPPPRSPYLDHFIQKSPPLVPLVRSGGDAPPGSSLEYTPAVGGSGEQADTLAERLVGATHQGTDEASDDEDGMEERATQIGESRLASLGVRLFEDWNELAMEAETRERKEDVACASVPHCTIGVLLAQWKAFMEWKTTAEEEASRKDAYNRRCDRLAARARQIYIMTTALALWHHHAGDRAERTAVARRHILRLRHFDSWKDLALSEERAVRVFAQSLYFPRWVDRHQALARADEVASEAHQKSILSKAFTTWQFGAFEQTVQLRRRQNLTESTFEHWRQLTSSAEKVYSRVQSLCQEQILAKASQEWRAQASHLEYQDTCTWPRFREATLSSAFHLWTSSPLPKQVTDDLHTANSLTNIFSAWHLESQVETIQKQRDHRLMSETFTSWMTFQRLADFHSQRGHTLMETVFQLLLHRSGELEDQANRNSVVQAARRVSHTSVVSLFQTWSSATAIVSAAGNIADDGICGVTRIAHLNIWHGAVLHKAELERWAQRGYSFLAIQGNFDIWRQWARCERERKLRATYTRAKHSTNLRLVLGCLRMWKTTCDLNPVLQDAADRGCHTHGRDLLHTAMDRWISNANHDTNSDRRCQGLIAEGLFEEWVGVATEYADGESETSGVWIERLAGSCWNSWDITHQWTEGQGYNAEKAAQRRDRELAIRIFLQWVDSISPDLPVVSDAARRGLHNFGRSDIAWGGGRNKYQYTPARAQSWSRSNALDYNAHTNSRQSDNQDDELDSIVGGMNTPTRWTGFARPLVGLSTTTPSGALSTPYERELRIRYLAEAGTMGRGRGGPDTHDSGVSSEHVPGGSGGL